MLYNIWDKIKRLPHYWAFWLFLITAIAIIIRSIPAWTNAAWGSDFGIYFGLTKDFVETGELYNPYYGWGSTYNFFPVLYSISGIIHFITGLDVITVLTNIAPIVGGLTVLITYFLVYELLKNRKIALISALILSVLPFHVYQLSHAAPLTMGHFFMILSLFLFVKFRKNTIFIYPLAISTLLLVMSHHLTTYFYLISIIFISFFENASIKVDRSKIRKDFLYAFFTSVLIFSYWAFIATPVYDGFMSRGFSLFGIRLGSTFILAGFFILLILSFFIAKHIKDFSEKIIEKHLLEKNKDTKNLTWFLYILNPFIRKGKPSIKSRIYLFTIALSAYFITLLLFVNSPLPWQGFSLTIEAILLITPFLIFLALALTGFRYTSSYKNGFIIRGWTISLLFSLLYAMISNNSVLLPHRHFEYLMYPISILAVLGIGGIFSDPELKKIFSNIKRNFQILIKKPKKSISRLSIIPVIFLSALIITSAASVYPTHDTLNKSYPHVRDKIYIEDISVIEWMGENIDKNNSVVASDHCIERLIESEDIFTTQDRTQNIWAAENLSDYFEEILGITKSHNKITHIVIDKLMREEYVQYGLIDKKPKWTSMTNESYEKFNNSKIFNLVYRNESIEIDPITNRPIFWAEVYEVNWSYINTILY